MVMPRAKILFSTGCVSQVTNSATRSSLVMYIDRTEIAGLHAYFAGVSSVAGHATIADDILADGAYTTVDNLTNSIEVPTVIRKPFGLKSSHRIYRISSGMSRPGEITAFPHAMEPSYYYWTRHDQRKKSKKK
ncbi:MAG TPA: hypothetical protein VID24_02285 [Candidatus Eremiobacteraceae bacterium]|jgi:hypothetical protein